MLATMNEVLKIAEERKIAIGSFNTPNLENIIAVLDAATKYDVPVILMHAEVHEEVVPIKYIAPVMVALAKTAPIPVCVHLDHCETLEYLEKSLKYGFTSVMYDGSLLPYDENVANTKKAVEIARRYGASVEAEIGILGGREAGSSDTRKIEDMYTDPDLALKFVEETKIDALAASFGTAHGFYATAPKLDFERIAKINSLVDVPLVMHGGSGVSPEDYLTAINLGIRKVNYYSYMAKAGTEGMKQYLQKSPDVAFYHELVNAAISNMTENVEKAIQVFSKQGSEHMKKSRVAMMTAVKTFEIQEYDIPEVGDDEMLIRVEGCGVCGTDVHEYKDDPFGCLPIILGHEGTGEIVKLGKNVKLDAVGNEVKVGDKIVTSISVCGECDACKNMPAKTELCENMGCYGLTPDDEIHLNGWFADYLFIRKNSNFYKVNEFDVNTRIMIEPLAVAVQAVERAKSTNMLTFNTKCVVNGAGPIGMSVLTVLKTMGIKNIIMIDGNAKRLALAKQIGATDVLNFKDFKRSADMIAKVKELTNNVGAGFVFQTTGNAAGFATALKFVKRGGGFCEVGYFVELGEVSINPHTDICHKEITLVGSYAYSPQIYPITIDMVRSALDIGIPISEMVTDWYPLEQITEAFDKNMSMEGLKIAVGPRS